jgi:sphingolipid 4-desaturase/C4-monooxygenase
MTHPHTDCNSRSSFFELRTQGYHIDHHKNMGQDGIDTDLPTQFELMCLNNVLGKVFFAYVFRPFVHPSSLYKAPALINAPHRTFQILFYALRPPFVKSQRLTTWHVNNIVSQITFDILLVYLSG